MGCTLGASHANHIGRRVDLAGSDRLASARQLIPADESNHCPGAQTAETMPTGYAADCVSTNVTCQPVPLAVGVLLDTVSSVGLLGPTVNPPLSALSPL